jgi:hypothetical protein
VALPSGAFLLCNLWGPSLIVDPATLATHTADEVRGQPPDDDPAAVASDPAPLDVHFRGQQIIVGHGTWYSNSDEYAYLSVLPGLGKKPRYFATNLEKYAGAHFGIARAAVLGKHLVLVGRNLHRSGSDGHAMVSISAEGKATLSPDPMLYANDPQVEVAADSSANVVYVYGHKSLEALDASVSRVGFAKAHAFTSRFRLLGGDGKGRMLWKSLRQPLLCLTGAGQFAPASLPSSLDRALVALGR